MKEFWDNRYAETEFAYGEVPNKFFKKELDKLIQGKYYFQLMEKVEILFMQPKIIGSHTHVILVHQVKQKQFY